MFYFGNGLDPLWPLIWLAPLPVLVFALRNKWWSTAIVAVAAMLVGNLNMWSYFTKTIGMPWPAWASIFLAIGIVTLLVEVPAAHSWTIYQLLGDWFAWLAIALFGFA